jgi:hypothetical protein
VIRNLFMGRKICINMTSLFETGQLKKLKTI